MGSEEHVRRRQAGHGLRQRVLPFDEAEFDGQVGGGHQRRQLGEVGCAGEKACRQRS